MPARTLDVRVRYYQLQIVVIELHGEIDGFT